MSECTHDCSSCSSNCSDREKPQSLIAEMNSASDVKKVIGIVSGKGGVGKSTVTSLLAVEMSRRGHKCAILDADVTGPSIPRSFGVKGEVQGSELGMFPMQSKTGVEIMSVNLLLDDESKPVVWRGPVIAGVVKQFWSEVVWNDVDFMFVDMPPGTGDVPLTVFQSLPLDGIIIVGTPQELVSMIVKKAVNMADLMNIPIIGLVENYSYAVCPDCGKKIDIFGKSRGEKTAEEFNTKLLAGIPIDPRLSALCDKGIIELAEDTYVGAVADELEKL